MIDKNIFIVDNVFDDDTNNIFISKIKRIKRWFLSPDEDSSNLNKENLNNFSDTGFLLESFYSNRININQEFDYINSIADLILEKTLIKFNQGSFLDVSVHRHLWNYYNSSSTGTTHNDVQNIHSGNFASMLYFLNTPGSFTLMGNLPVENISGRAIIFNSRLLHKGNPIKNKTKFALNTVFTYSNFIIKK